MITKKRIAKKTSKGYRLKDSTHKMIEKLQLIINGSKDTVISRALKLYYDQINIEKKTSLIENKNQQNNPESIFKKIKQTII